MPRLGSLLTRTGAAAVAAAVAAGVGTGLAAAPSYAVRTGPADLGAPVTQRVPVPAAGHHLMLDTCETPALPAVRAWQRESPYRAIAVYVGVRADWDSRHCKTQANLTAGWVDGVLAGRWQVLPIQVGLQAPCSGYKHRMSASAPTARAQGAAAAVDAAAHVRALRIPATSPVVADIEAYAGDDSCTAAVQSYVAGWTSRLRQLGLRSAVYGSRSSTIQDVTDASTRAGYPQPDVLWVANFHGPPDTTFSVPPATMWVGRRISQFNPNVTRYFGGYQLTIDENAVQDSVWDRTAPRLVAAPPPRATKRGRIRLGWRSVDPSGVARYQVRVRHDGRRWQAPRELRSTGRTSRAFSLRPGERWCVSARATDRVGNTSAWSAPACTVRFTDDRALRDGRGWTRVRGGYRGTGTKALRKGAVLHGRRVSGRHVGVILHGRGTVVVSIGGRPVGQLRGNGTKWLTLPATRTGRLAIRTATRGRVVVDGYAVTP